LNLTVELITYAPFVIVKIIAYISNMKSGVESTISKDLMEILFSILPNDTNSPVTVNQRAMNLPKGLIRHFVVWRQSTDEERITPEWPGTNKVLVLAGAFEPSHHGLMHIYITDSVMTGIEELLKPRVIGIPVALVRLFFTQVRTISHLCPRHPRHCYIRHTELRLILRPG
jgi:hypothetical protein